jgi:hypothetical protein
LGALFLVTSTLPATAQERPPAGEGSVFVDELGRLNLFLTDLEGDFMRVVFPGSPNDFVRLSPDGRVYLHAQDVSVVTTVETSSGDFFSGSAKYEETGFVRCPIFDPFTPNFQCFFPGEGSAVINSRGSVKDVRGKVFDLRAHVTGIFLSADQPGGPVFRTILSDIDVTPARRRLRNPPFISPTHLGAVPAGALIALDEQTAMATGLGDIGFTAFSGLAMSHDGRLFGSLGFGGSGLILEIDSATTTVIRTIPTGFAAVPGLDFAPEGTLFAGTLFGVAAGSFTDPNDYFLFMLDTATGATTRIGGTIGVPSVDSIVFTNDGTLFGVGFIDGAVLFEIDPLTGSAANIRPIGFYAVAGLEAASDGFLLGSLGGTDPNPGSLIRIDPVTGFGTLIGFTGYSPVSGLARLPDMPDLAGLR